MHTLDILFIIGSIFFIVIGIRRGLIGEIFRFIALVAGFFVAFLYYPEIASLFRFKPAVIGNGIAFTCIFLVVALVIIGIGWLLKKVVHLTPLGWADWIFGGIIGFLKTILIFWVVCLSLSSFPAGRFIFGLNRSFVYQTYKKFPEPLKLSGLTELRALFKKSAERDLPKKLRKMKNRIDSVVTPDVNYR